MTKHTNVTVALTQEEKELLKAKAKAEGISLNAYCKQILLNADFGEEVTTNIEFLLSDALFNALISTIKLYFDRDFSRLIISMDAAKKLQKIGNLKTTNKDLLMNFCELIYGILFADEPEILNTIINDAKAGIKYSGENGITKLLNEFGYTRREFNMDMFILFKNERMQPIYKSHKVLRECFCSKEYDYDLTRNPDR